MQRSPKVAIAGGGIGGLTLALSLHDAGIRDVDIYESTPEIRELGVGINLLPHAVRELTELSMAPALESLGIPTAELAFYNKHGHLIWQEPRGLPAGYHWPQYSIHRGELLMALYRAVVDRLGADRVHTGHHLHRFGPDVAEVAGGGERSRVWADFIDRGTGKPFDRIEADVLVGADGVRSTVRQALYPAEGPPKWNGITMWRGVTVGKPFLSGRSMIMTGYFGLRVVAYSISKRHENEGRALINWVAEAQTEAGPPVPPQDWDHRGRLEDVLGIFESFVFPWLDLRDLFLHAERIYQYPMVDRDPLPRWSFGPVTLLGDAAHPMYPVGANGASQAVLDARVLARALSVSGSIGEALAAYESERRPTTSRLVLLNRESGPEQCMDLAEKRAPGGFGRIEDVISARELDEIARRYKTTAGFDRDTLNRRASLSVRPLDPLR